jgi:hypothetical protein
VIIDYRFFFLLGIPVRPAAMPVCTAHLGDGRRAYEYLHSSLFSVKEETGQDSHSAGSLGH